MNGLYKTYKEDVTMTTEQRLRKLEKEVANLSKALEKAETKSQKVHEEIRATVFH